MTKKTFVTCVIVAMMLSMTLMSGVMGTTRSTGTEVTVGTGPSMDLTGAPVGFLENLGQFPDGDVLYYQGLSYGGVAFTADGVILSVMGPSEGDPFRARMDRNHEARKERAELVSGLVQDEAWHTVRLVFVEANDATPSGREMMEGVHNFFLGNDPGAWRTGVRAYTQVVYEDLWEGIDLVYSLTDNGLKYEFLVSPGADPSRVRVSVEGHEGLSIADGNLLISTSVGDITDGGLSVFHQDEVGVPLRASFVLLDDDTYSFDVAGRQADRTLVIDPWVFATYVGGTGDDGMFDVHVDADGDIYGAGVTDSTDFPTSTGAFQGRLNGMMNAAVTKLSSDGTSLVFSTYIGGDNFDIVNAMYVDINEDVYICGDTISSTFPVTAGAYQSKALGPIDEFIFDSFVTKLDAGGGKLDYSTYLGADDEHSLLGIAVDGSGNAYVTGWTASFNMTCSVGAYQTSKMGDDWYWDAIVRVLDSTGGRQLYATYLGGDDDDEAYDIALNGSGQVLITGLTYSEDFPTTAGSYMSRYNNAWTLGFVTKLKSDLTSLHYSTYLGGTEDQELYAMAIDRNDNATVTGYVYSTDYPVTDNAYDNVLGFDDQDAVVSMLSADGSRLVYSTFLGGDGEDEGMDIAIGPSGKIHVGGNTYSSFFPTTTGAVQTNLKGDSDGFYAVFDSQLSDLEMGTYIGGNGEDYIHGVLPVGYTDGYLAGYSISTDFPTTTGAYQTRHGGGEVDAILGQLTFDSIAPFADAGPDVTIDQHETVDFNGSNCYDNIEIVNWSWRFRYGGETVILYGTLASFTFDDAGVYEVTLTVSDAALLKGVDALTVTVRDITPPVAEAGSTRSIDQHDLVIFNGVGSTDNVAVVNWTWSFSYGGEEIVLYGPDPEFTFDEAGEFNVTLTILDGVGLSDTDLVRVYVKDITDPVAEAGVDIEIDQHGMAVLDASGCSDNVGVVNWTWSFVYRGTPVSLFGETVDFIFDNAGSYEVNLAVTDDAGNLAMDFLTVRVKDITPPTANAGVDLEVIQGTTVYLDGTGSDDNIRVASYTWTFEYQGMPLELTGSGPHYYFEAAGQYEITLVVADLEGNSGTDTVLVTVLDITNPEADAGDDITIDQGHTASFDGMDSTDNLDVATWTWTFDYQGEEVELTGPFPTYVFEDAGVYTIDLVVVDAAGNAGEDDLKVTVMDITDPVAVAGDDRTSDQGQAVPLDGSASTDNVDIDLYIWTFDYGGGSETLNGRNMQFIFDAPGDYTITLTVTDAAGNEATDAFDLHVRDTVIPTPPTMSNIEANAGEKVTLDAQAAYDNVGVVKWTWTFKEDGKTRTLDGAKVSHTFDTAGDYEVTLTIEDAEGNVATTTFDVTVAGSSWLWVILAIVLVVVMVAAFLYMRGRGGMAAEEETTAEEEERTNEIIIEERFAE